MTCLQATIEGMQTQLFGRRNELELLKGFLSSEDGGSFAVLCGEPGMGKTALLGRFGEIVAQTGIQVLSGRAVADEGAPMLWPWLQVLEQGREFGLSEALLEAGDGPPAEERFLALERTATALLRAAEPAGLMIVLDDLQWADETSLRLLHHLCRELSGSRLFVVGATRDLIGVPDVTAVRALVLRPLSEIDVAEYLRSSSAGRVDESWVRYVHRHSGGNPLYIRELTRVLVAEDRLHSPAVELPLPVQLTRMAAYRLDQLGSACRWLLGGCSVLGEAFEASVLASVVGLEVERVPDLLAEALAAGVLIDEPASPNRLQFSHAIIRQARYEELPRDERVWWHRHIADALSLTRGTRPGEVARHRVRAAVDTASCRLALQACRVAAGSVDGADSAHWYRRAVELADMAGCTPGERAEVLLESAEASYRDGRLSEALERCREVVDIAETTAATALDPGLAARAALVVRAIGGERLNLVIAELCERALALLGDDRSGDLGAVHARVLAQQTLALAEAADYVPNADALTTAESLSRRAMVMAEDCGDPTALVDAMHARERLATGLDGVAERLELAARLRKLGTVPGRPEAQLWAHLWRIDGLLPLGQISAVDNELLGLASLVERLGWPLGRWHLLRGKTVRALLSGRFDEAERLATAAGEVAERTQDVSMQDMHYAYLIDIARMTGRFGEHDNELLRVAESIPIPIVLALMADYRLAAGDSEHAMALFEQLRPGLPTLARNAPWATIVKIAGELAATFNDRDTATLCYRMLRPYAAIYPASMSGYPGSIARTLGVIASYLGEHDAADRYLSDAETMERRIGAPADHALACLAHARALIARGAAGDHEHALALAEQCIRTTRRLGMAPALAAACALADGLTGTGSAAVLTPREREIAKLVADGLSNKTIAERLVLSERTVETHVRNLLAKLRLANRAQVVSWALRSGLRS